MNSLIKVDFKVLNSDIITYPDGTEFIKLQGIVPMSEKKKESVLSGTYEIMEIFDKFSPEYEQITAIAKDVDVVKFSGYYNKYKFKPVTIDDVIKLKK